MASRAERYLAHLDSLSGGIEPEFHRIEPEPGGAPVSVIVYPDTPEPGHFTAFTYGLSLADHPAWRFGRPELCVSVRSADIAWALVAGRLAARLRGRCPFTYGDLLDYGAPVSAESPMHAFVVFAPMILERADHVGIDVGDGDPADQISIAQLYPVHPSELEYLTEHGLTEEFWQQEWDPFDVTRPPAR